MTRSRSNAALKLRMATWSPRRHSPARLSNAPRMRSPALLEKSSTAPHSKSDSCVPMVRLVTDDNKMSTFKNKVKT